MQKKINQQIRIYNKESLLNQIVTGKSYHSSLTSILIIKKGYITFLNTFETITLTENKVLFLFPKGIFEFIDMSEDLEISIIAINVDLFSQISYDFNRYSLYQFLTSNYLNHFNISKATIKELWVLIDLLKSNLQKNQNKYNKTILLSLITVILYTVIEALDKSNSSIGDIDMNRKQELVLNFLKLLSENFKENRKVSFYADKLSVTSRHLSATVKKVTQKTANQVIHQFVISEAKTLLNTTTKQIAQIALELNFKDQYCFSKFFKKNTEFSPTKFRSKNK